MGEEQNLPMETIGGARIANFIMGKVNNWREKQQINKEEMQKQKQYEGLSEEEFITKFPKVAQALLKNEGYDLGTSGENKDGIDGNWGKRSKAALAKLHEKGYSLINGKITKTQTNPSSATSVVPGVSDTKSTGIEYLSNVINNLLFKDSETEKSTKKSGKAFYISYPNHRISTSGTGLSGIFGKNIPLIKGHSASILIDDKGNATYHTYGRYGDMGSYKSWSLPAMKQDESNEAYLKRIRSHLEYANTNEAVRASYIPEIDYQKATEYYSRKPEKGNYSLFNGTTCAGEACRGIDAGTGADSSGIFDWFAPDTPENIHRINYKNYEKIDF